MRTKLFTVLVGIRKQDQGAGKSVYHYAPVQDFSILWTDEMLYEKYGISEEEFNMMRVYNYTVLDDLPKEFFPEYIEALI